MLLLVDDERTLREALSLQHREFFRLPPLTEKQKDILQKDIRKHSVAKTYKEAKEFIITNGLPDLICFDHDLGLGKLVTIF